MHRDFTTESGILDRLSFVALGCGLVLQSVQDTGESACIKALLYGGMENGI